MPRDGTLYVRGLGGLSAWRSEFGFGTSPANYNAVLTDLPRYTDEVAVGSVHTGDLLNFIFKTGSTCAFSTGSTFTDREAFTDRDNSLGWGGTIVQATAPNTWVLHLDDYFGDDDDNDSWVQLRIDSGTAGTGEIHGRQWNDRNGDGTRDGDEPGLPGWTVFLDYNANSRLDPGEDAVQTDPNGDYVFTQLQPWTYTVAEVGRNGWTQTYPGGNGMHVVTVASGQVVTGQDFGNQGDEVPPRITAVLPDPATPATQGVRQIRLTFSEAMERATMWAPSFALLGSGGDGTFADGNENIVEIANVVWSDQNLSGTLTMNNWLSRDTYRLTALDDLIDLSGNRLDGDGDCTAGGTWQRDFRVANTPPATNDGQAATVQDAPVPLVLSATDPDGDAITFVPGNPLHGTLTDLGDANSSTWLYTPELGFHGQDSFTFTASDGTATSQPATFGLSVAPAPCDLEPTLLDVTSPPHFSMGDTITVHWTGVNHGPGETLDGWWRDWQDRLYLSADGQLDGADLALGTWSSGASPVAVNGTYDATLNVTLPDREWSGQYHLILAVNVDRGQVETNVANNLRVLPIELDPFVRFVLPSVGRYADNETPIGFQWVDGDQAHSATLALAFDPDDNPGNGNETWLASGISEDAEGQADQAQLYLPNVAPGEYFVRAKLTNADGDYFSPSAPIRVFERAYYSAEAMNDATGGTGYEVGGIEAGIIGDRVYYRVLSNFPPINRGGDIYLNVGGLWQDHNPTDIVHGVAVNATTAYRGPLTPGDLYTNATFRTGIYHPERPTFITAYQGHRSGYSAAEVTSPVGIKTTYQIEGWFDLTALPGYIGQAIQLAWAMYCGNDIDDVIIPGRDAPDLAVTSIKYRPDEGIAGGIHQSAEPGRQGTWEVVVANVGNQPTNGSWTLDLLLSASQALGVPGSTVLFHENRTETLAAGDSLPLVFSAPIPQSLSAGFYYFGAQVTSVAGETYTDNNTLVNPESFWVESVTPDNSEENDSFGTARELDSLTLNGLVCLQQRTIDAIGDADWYHFTLPGTGPAGARATIRFDAEKGDLRLGLYDNTGAPIAVAPAASAGTSSLSLQSLPSGVYYLKVEGVLNDVSPDYYLEVLTTAPPTMTITGHVTYRDNDNNTTERDAAFVKVEAWEKQAFRPTDYLIASGYTNALGVYTFTQDASNQPIYNRDDGVLESGTRDIYLRIYAENEAVRVVDSALGSIVTWTAVYEDVPGTVAAIDVNIIKTDETSTHAAAYGIPGFLYDEHEWFAGLSGTGWRRPQVTAVYPSPLAGLLGNSLYCAPIDQIHYIEAWQGTGAHEYGHAIHGAARGGLIGDLPGGPGPSPHYPWTEAHDLGFAISEGWAVFVAKAFDNRGFNLEGDPGGADDPFWMGDEGQPGIGDADGLNANGSLGNDVEDAVASIFWDLYDGASPNDDPVAPRFADVWDVFLNTDPDSIWNASGSDDFYHYWNQRIQQGNHVREIDEIFLDHGIPVIDDQYDDGVYNRGSGNDTRGAGQGFRRLNR